MNGFLRFVFGVILAGALAIGGFVGVLFFHEGTQDTVLTRVMGNAIERNTLMLQEKIEPLGGDNLDIVFCGTASPMGGADRAQSCIAVLAGPHFYLIDAGPRAASRLGLLGLPLGRLDGIMLTHFHSDHIGGLGEIHLLSWVAGRKGRLSVYGGPGVENVVTGFNESYGLDYIYRSEHHGTDLLNPQDAGMRPRLIEMEGDSAQVVAQDGLSIRALRVVHEPIAPAYGYVISWRGRTVVISGDTVKLESVGAASRDADVLIHEALAPDLVERMARALNKAGNLRLARVLRDTLDYHTTPKEAAELANDANVRLLVLSHLAPTPANRLVERAFLREAAKLRSVRSGELMLAYDGLHLRLPADSRAIDILQR